MRRFPVEIDSAEPRWEKWISVFFVLILFITFPGQRHATSLVGWNSSWNARLCLLEPAVSMFLSWRCFRRWVVYYSYTYIEFIKTQCEQPCTTFSFSFKPVPEDERLARNCCWVEFDDGDSGEFPLPDVRRIPPDFSQEGVCFLLFSFAIYLEQVI